MKISKKSWHYQLIKLVGWNHPASLCAYFWAVVFAPVKALWVVFCVVAGIAIAAGPIAQFVVDAPFVWVLVGGGLDIAALAVLLMCRIDDRRYKKRLERIQRGEDVWSRPERQPSLLREWLRAKHEKICPMLEFEYPSSADSGQPR